MKAEIDTELVKSIQTGSKGAFSKLYSKYYHLIRFYCWKIVKNEETVKDLVQETFIKALEKINSFKANEERTNVRGWLIQIAFGISVDYLRHQSRERDVVVTAISRGNVKLHRERDPQKVLMGKEAKEACLGAINELPKIAKDCVVSHYLFGISREDICKSMGMEMHQIDYQLKSGRKALAIELKRFRISQNKFQKKSTRHIIIWLFL